MAATDDVIQSFNSLMAELDYPMFVVTTVADDGERSGCLVGFATQISIKPPRFLAGLSHKNRTYRVAQRAEHLGVHFVPADDKDLAEIVAMCALDDWPVADLAASCAGPPTSPSWPTRCSDACSTCCRAGTRPTSSPSCGPASCGTGSSGTVRGRAGRAAPGRHQRRHHPRPWAVRRVPARRHPRRRARRGDGLREPARRDVPARRVHLAHRGHHPRAGGRHAGAGPAREDAVLARRRPRPPARARAGRVGEFVREIRALPAGRGARRGCATRHDLDDAGRRATCSSTSTSRPRPPARCPTTAPSWSSGSATRSATGGSACSRRSAPRCTRRGPWRCRPGWPSGGASTSS